MEWQGQCTLCPCVMRLSLSLLLLLLLILPMLLLPVSGEEIFMGRPEQGSAWELPLKHAACDPFTLVCAEETGDYKSGNHETDLNIIPKGAVDETAKKAPLCTVNCFRADPVCGSDGVTYWCGVAEAKCAEVEVAHEGYCDIWNGGVGANLGLHAAQSLQLVHMVWLVLAGLLIVIGLP